MDLSELLRSEGIDESEVDALVSWAHDRAAALADALADDPELGPLLRPGGVAGEQAAIRASEPEASPHEPGSEPHAAPEHAEAGAPAEPMPREDSYLRQPLPPIPSEQPGYESQQITVATATGDDEEIEELDDIDLIDEEDLELVDDEGEAEAPLEPRQDVPEWKAALATAQEGDEVAIEARMANRTEDSASIRLRPEEDEIREHDVDLSDIGAD